MRNFRQLKSPEKLIEFNELSGSIDFSILRGGRLSGNRGAGFGHSIIIVAVGCAILGAQGKVFAADSGIAWLEDQTETIDGRGFAQTINENQFSSNLRIEGNSLVNSRSRLRLNSVLEVEPPAAEYASEGLLLDDDAIADTQGFKVRRFATAVESSHGTLTVGSDWSNFQDFLGSDGIGYSVSGQNSFNQNGLTSEQIRWNSTNGFSVALETEAELSSVPELNNYAGDNSSPSMILSWNGSDPARRGQYSFSVLGRQLQSGGVGQVENNEEKLGWGLNLAGGWRFGEMFAALRVTLGNSIDRYILGRFSNGNSANSTSGATTFGESFNINPSLNYRLDKKSNIHVAINRFESDGGDNVFGVDTLDTIHLGYTWNPWPSTQFGVEFVGKDVEGNSELSDSNEVNFAASKRF